MKLFYQSGVFAVVSTFAEKDVVKAAGFWWHGIPCQRSGCLACAAGLQKAWWTPKVEVAVKFRSVFQRGEGSDPFGQIDEAVDASRATDAVITIPCPSDLEYLGYQKAGIAYACARQNTLIADEMGLGKTIQALGLINARPCENVLVVCPKSVKLNWQREAEKWLVDTREFFQVDSEQTALEAVADIDAPRMVFVNFEQVIKAPVLDALMRLRWDRLIVDEAQRIKNPEAQQTRAILGTKANPKRKIEAKDGLRQRSDSLLLLTGTPILNKPAESQGLLAACDPQFEGFSFLMRYCAAHKEMRGGRSVWNFDGHSNLDELQMKARASCMVRRLKKDVLKELPPKRRQIVPIVTDTRTGKLLQKEETLAGPNYEEQVWDLASYRAHPSIHELAELRHELGLAKVKPAIEHITNVLAGCEGKVIVFAHHKDVVAQLAEGLGTDLVITGDTKTEDRQRIVDTFQQAIGPAQRVIIGTIGAMGVGLTLTAAQTVIFVELSYVPADVSQGEDRAHRIGQQGSVLVQHLVFDGSLDSRIAKRLVTKQAVIDRALDTKHQPAPLPVVEAPAPTPPPKVYPPVSPEEAARALAAMKFLAARCDGAASLDGAGFSKIDVEFGKSLASKQSLTDGQAFHAQKLMRKYHRQLEGLGD